MSTLIPHIQTWLGDAIGFVDRVRPPAIKVMDDAINRDRLLWYKSIVPGGKIWGRVWTDDVKLTSPKATATAVVSKIFVRVANNWDLFDYFECDMNESQQTYPHELIWHNEFTVEALRIMHTQVPSSVKLGVGCFGVGNPANPNDITFFADAIEASDFLTTHEYGWPTMMDGNGYWCLRYRLMRAALQRLGRPGVLKPWHIGECGRDRGLMGPQPPTDWGAWRNNGTPIEYANDLRYYRTVTSQDAYIGYLAVFNLGGYHMWRNFEIGGEPELDKVFMEGDMNQGERERYKSDIWRRRGVPLNKDAAIYKYWSSKFDQGVYIGSPEEPEHPTENGKYIVQAFAGAILWCEKGVWIVKEGLPPLV